MTTALTRPKFQVPASWTPSENEMENGIYYDENGQIKVVIGEIYAPAYYEFWNTRKFYRVVKGAKGSGKSYQIALWYIYHMMKPGFEKANVLVIRKVADTMRDSCFAALKWAIDRLKVGYDWESSVSPLRLRRKSTGQTILFKGLDKPEKLMSIGAEKGFLCWVWFEEFFEIPTKEEFEKIVMSVRGRMPAPLFKQVTCSFNPWSENTWIKPEFFDQERPDAYVTTTTFRDNPYLDPDSDIPRYLRLYETSPRQARVQCDGDWGISEGLIYENWEVATFDIQKILASNPNIKTSFGLDFGYSVSFNALSAMAIDLDKRVLWIYDELYFKGVSNLDIAKAITRKGFGKEVIYCDAAEPKSIFELQQGFTEEVEVKPGVFQNQFWQLPKATAALKGSDSVSHGIQFLQGFHMIVHPTCINHIRELNCYAWEVDRDGKKTGKPSKDPDCHCLVAGTLVTTNYGDTPIEEIQAGDMVLTHLGFRPVIASGITRPEPAEIWRLELDDGTVLEGTADHPIPTADGLKYMSGLAVGDEVIVCTTHLPEVVERERSSNTMVRLGQDIQKAKTGRSGYTIGAQEVITNISTDISGRSSMDQSQRGVSSITSMETPLTTIHPTSHAFSPQTTCMSTPSLMKEEGSLQSVCGEIQNVRINAEHGMPPQKDMSGTSSMHAKLQMRCNLFNASVSIVDQSIGSNLLEKANSAPMLANLLLEEHRGLTTRTEFVHNVAKSSEPITIANRNFAVARVRSIADAKRHEYVYDLTVEEAHDFFANHLLVLNCLDSLRYSASRFFIRGSGQVVGGMPTSRDNSYSIDYEQQQRGETVSKWVFSTL